MRLAEGGQPTPQAASMLTYSTPYSSSQLEKNHLLLHSSHLIAFSSSTNPTVPITMPNFWWHLVSVTATR